VDNHDNLGNWHGRYFMGRITLFCTKGNRIVNRIYFAVISEPHALASWVVFIVMALSIWGLIDIMNRISTWTDDIIKRIIAKAKGIYGIDTFDLFGIIFAITATIRVYMR